MGEGSIGQVDDDEPIGSRSILGGRVSRQRLLAWSAAVAALVALAVVGLSAGKGTIRRPAPALPTDRLSGQPVTLASLRGRPALVVFWASWCAPCEQEAPALERFARTLHGRATLVGVDYSDPSLSNAQAFVRRFAWTFPTLRDPEETSGQHYGVITLPTTFAIDASGHIRNTLRGPQTQATLAHALAGA